MRNTAFILILILFHVTLGQSHPASAEKASLLDTIEVGSEDVVFGTVRGKVLSSVTSLPLLGYEARLWGRLIGEGCLSDSVGQFEFVLVPSGTQHLRIQPLGYDIFDTLLQVIPDDTIDLQVTLRWMDARMALEDVQQHKARLFRIHYGDGKLTAPDIAFELNYGVKYCSLAPWSTPFFYESVAEYNCAIAEYLDKRFGPDWRQYVRNDVLLSN